MHNKSEHADMCNIALGTYRTVDSFSGYSILAQLVYAEVCISLVYVCINITLCFQFANIRTFNDRREYT